MAIFTWRTDLPIPVEQDLELVEDEVLNISPYDRSQEVAPRTPFWRSVMRFNFMELEPGFALQGFITRLRSSLNGVEMPVYQYRVFLGNNTGTNIQVNGAHSAGVTTLSVKNCVGSNPAFRTGDLISISPSGVPRLYQVMNEANHSGGVASLPILPPLRRAYNDSQFISTRLNTATPIRSTMRLEGGYEIVGIAAPLPGFLKPLVLQWVEPFGPGFT